MLLTAYLTARTSSSLFQKHPCLFVLAFGMACSKITIKLVVCIELEIFTQSVPVWETRGYVNLTLSGRPLKLWDLWGLG